MFYVAAMCYVGAKGIAGERQNCAQMVGGGIDALVGITAFALGILTMMHYIQPTRFSDLLLPFGAFELGMPVSFLVGGALFEIMRCVHSQCLGCCCGSAARPA